MTNTEWLQQNTTLKGKPFTIKGFEFQRAILDDQSRNMCVQKPSQTGLTETQIRKTLAFLVRNNGVSAIYTLPTEDMFKRISKGRIKPLLQKDRVFLQREGETRSQEQMQFRDSFLYVAPANEAAATSIAADAVIVDEVDLSDPRWVALLSSRLQGSAWKISHSFSTPKYPGFGINGAFRLTDQRRYLCKCTSCGHYNVPEFTSAFVNIPGGPDTPPLKLTNDDLMTLPLDEAYMGCEKCHARLPLDNPKMREWVAKYPNRVNARGYMVSPFDAPSITLPYILERMLFFRQRDFIQGFYNTVLGLPYTDEDLQIPAQSISKCFTEQLQSPACDKACSIGIDVGKTCHIVLGYAEGSFFHILKLQTVPIADLHSTVADLTNSYHIIAGAIDRNPYTTEADKLRDQTHHTILPVEYSYNAQKNISLIKDEYHEISHARIDRTHVLDRVANLIRLGPDHCRIL